MSFWRIIWRGLAVLLVLVLIAAALAWALRKDIARNYADAEIKRRGVPARYVITAIGPSRQRLERISLGDPAHPDLTADWAEIITATGFSGVSVKLVRAGGVRLRGRLVDGRATFGAVDKLLPAPSVTAFSLPDFRVDLADARLRLETPYGPLGARFDGRGNIANSLSGKLALVMPDVALFVKCRLAGLTAYLDISTATRRISANGPVRAGAADCAGVNVVRPQMAVDLVTSETFDRLDGNFEVETRSLRAADAALATSRASARLTWLAGALKADGKASATELVVAPSLLDRAVRLARAGSATPAAALGDVIADAVTGLKRGSNGQTRFSIAGNASAGTVMLDGVSARSASGATLAFASGSSAILNWPQGRTRINGGLTLAGGGFPATRIIFDRARAGLTGVATIAPIAVGGTRLALSPVRFATGAGTTRLDTVARYDGPLGGGIVAGLTVPVAVRGGRLIGECLPLAVRGYRIASLALAPLKTSVCLRNSQATTGPLDITARLGASPLSLAFKSARYGTDTGRFAAQGLAVRLGDASRLSTLNLASLSGTLKNGRVTGAFAGAVGQIGNVPLLLSEGAGNWAFANQVLTLGGALKVADAATARRYQPLVSDDVILRLADGIISARATLREPISRTVVSTVTITHSLPRSTGQAVLDVAGLNFNDAFQPEALTPITLGVIANVQGKVSGRGMIDWTADGVRSHGNFRTDALDFAAAFGPVTGLKGEIALSDLLGLETGPGQSVTIASINPGIAVTEGEVRYRLLPGLKIAVEGGRWPFAGGALILLPSVLDLNQSAVRRLTFRVDGLDAALFVQQMAFENIAVTGKFDGVLPMIFDQSGGRIENGHLTVRSGGGTLAYVGDVTNAELGRFSKLAFDALKSIRYKKLTLELNGALDGEMVTVVRFNGVNQLPLAHTKNFFLKQFNAIPFIFNITIKAPFRGLFTMMRSFNDPGMFLPGVLPPQLVPVEPAPKPAKPVETKAKPVQIKAKPVQTKESEPVR